MNHKPDVSFVDAHTEGNGGDDYLNFVSHPLGLDF
jgi:hypothetical protein